MYPRQEQAVERILKVLVPAGVFSAFYRNVPVARHRYAGIEHLPVLRENAFVLIEHVRDHAHAQLADVGEQLLAPVRAQHIQAVVPGRVTARSLRGALASALLRG